MLFFLFFGCSVLIKTPSEKGCEEAAAAFSTCASLSDQLEAPYTYDELAASVACNSQPDCLGTYFSCVAQAFSMHDCSTEEGADDAISAAKLCELPTHDSETCPIEEYLPDDDCGGVAPVIQEVTCSYTGIQFSENDNADLPSMNISVRVTDPDGDLTSYRLQVHVDDQIDGFVSEGARDFSFEGQTSAGICDTDESNLGIDLYLKGGFPYYSTTYEWFFSVEDASGMESASFMAVCTTPNEEGQGPQ